MKTAVSFLKTLALTVVLLGLTGCGDIVGDIQRGLEQAGKEFVFDALVERAESNGGTAKLLQPGEEFILEITDEESPIFGTKIIIPADGLPSRVTEAVLAAYHMDGFELTENVDYSLQGPVVRVELQDLTTDQVGETITLDNDATVLIPHGVSVDPTGLVLGHLKVADRESSTLSQNWEAMETAIDTERPRIEGKTKEFGSFAALGDADALDPLVYSYVVKDVSDEVLCEGNMANSVILDGQIIDEFSTTVSLDVDAGGDGDYSLTLTYDGHQTEFPHTAITAMSQSLTCGGLTYTSDDIPANSNFEFQTDEWEVEESAPETCGANDTPCTILTGTALMTDFATTFVDGDGNEVVLTLQGGISDFTYDSVIED